MKKVLFVATVVKQHIMTFHIPSLKLFKENGWVTAVAAKNDYDNQNECCIPCCDRFFDVPFERTPVHKRNWQALKELKNIIKTEKYDLIHCHTPTGGLIARIAAMHKRRGGTKVIYTAHGFHFYKGAPLKNWLLYFPAEWICSFFTDVLITINKEDYNFALKHMHPKKVEYVPGVGFDLNKTNALSVDKKAKREEIGIKDNKTVLFSVGELNDNKNHKTVINAIKDMDVYYVIAGCGEKEKELRALADELGISDKVRLIGYRNDVLELHKAADIFVFPSFREGLPVSLMEAMASGLPCAVSNVRGNKDLIDKNGGTLFDPYSVDDCRMAIKELLEADKEKCAQYNINKVKQFSIENVNKIMSELYKI